MPNLVRSLAKNYMPIPIKKQVTRCVFTCLSGLFCLCSAKGQEVFSQKSAVLLSKFAFTQLTGGVVIFKAKLDNYKDSLNFILDTGSGGISLDSSTVLELKIPNVPTDLTIRGIAGIRQVRFAYNHMLRLPGLNVDSLNFHINDYSLLSSVYGFKIDGIVGYSFLRRYLVKIDYDRLIIDVFEPGNYRYPRGGVTLKPALAGLPMQYTNFTESRNFTGRFYLDTGAGLCVLFNQDYCVDSAIFSPNKKFYASISEGLGGKKETLLTVLKSFKIGDYTFKNVPVSIFDDEFNVTSYPFLGGLIGNDLLRRFNVIINYPRSEIHLLPNTHFRDEFDYSYTGFSLYLDGTDIIIDDVLKNSPADKAGLKSGDVVIGVENDLSNNLQQYKLLLQNPRQKVRILYRRNGIIDQTKLTIINIKKR